MRRLKLFSSVLLIAICSLAYGENSGIDPQAFELAARKIESGHLKNGIKEMSRLAELGDARAQYLMGITYKGETKGSGVKKDYTKCFQMFQKSAAQGFVKSEFELGMLYLNGEGVKKNLVQALKYLSMAAEKGDPNAQYDLGVMYLNGECVARDFKKATELFKTSYEGGYPDAKYAYDKCLDHAKKTASL